MATGHRRGLGFVGFRLFRVQGFRVEDAPSIGGKQTPVDSGALARNLDTDLYKSWAPFSPKVLNPNLNLKVLDVEWFGSGLGLHCQGFRKGFAKRCGALNHKALN